MIDWLKKKMGGKTEGDDSQKLFNANAEISAKMAELARRMASSVDMNEANEASENRWLQELRKEGRGF